jgi:cobalt-zinc-cadmium efflux system protein
MGHDHAHGLSAEADARRLGGAFALIVAFMLAEVVAGIVGSSLALLSDAGHMLTDAVALGLALAALRLAERPPTGSYTYGMKRAEILSAQLNGVTLLLLGVLIGGLAISASVVLPLHRRLRLGGRPATDAVVEPLDR